MKNQKNSTKIKSMYVLKYFITQTDEQQPACADDIIGYLNSLGICAERKSIYKDISVFKALGIEIHKKGHGFYYKPTEGDFLHEIAAGIS